MKFQARCPYCRCKFRAPESMLGASVECPRCKTYISLFPVDEAATAASAREVGPAAVAAAPAAPTATVAATTATMSAATTDVVPAPVVVVSSTPAAVPVAGQISESLTAGHVALYLGAAAVLCSFLPIGYAPTMLLSGIGVVIGVGGLWLGDRPYSVGLHTLAPAVCAGVLCVGGLFPLSARSPDPAPPAAPAPPSYVRFKFKGNHPREGKLDPVELRDGVWADADRQAVRVNGVAVGVGSVGVETVRLRADGKETNSDPCLVVRLQLLCEATDRRMTFEGWGDGSGSKAGVSLTEPARNVALPPRRFAAGVEVVDRKLELIPFSFADDVLVYALPRGKLSSLRLQLPASTVGGTGVVRFLIPASMIKGVAGGRL